MKIEIGENEEFVIKVDAYIQSHFKGEWNILNDLIPSLCCSQIGPRALLQSLCCKSVGGTATNAVPLTASMELIHQAVRILDDIQDKNIENPVIQDFGIGTSLNIVIGLIMSANKNLIEQFNKLEFYKPIYEITHKMGLRLLDGQSSDICEQAKTLDTYWDMISRKSGASFALICMTGAMCGTTDKQVIQSFHDFGHEIGIIAQILNDFEGFWMDPDDADLKNKKYTLPIVYGLEKEHPRKNELLNLLESNDWLAHKSQILEILSTIQVKEFVILLAFKARKRALGKLADLGESASQELRKYLDVLFMNIETLV